MMQTRAQADLILAERLVSEVAREPEQVRSIYGGLCHNFPILVRTCGLCQAVAFSLSKGAADSPRGRAHQLLLAHVGQILGQKDVLTDLRTADTMAYLRHTRRVLDAFLYFKRFAVSVLKVESSQAAEEDQGAGV